MLYHISRNGQMFGPYTLAELQRYVLSGNILPTDLAKNDAMPEWLPVQQVLGTADLGAQPPVYPPAYAPAYAPASNDAFPDPPNLPWALVMLFDILTCGLFMIVWNIIVAAWMKRVQPTSQAILYYIGGAVLLFAGSGASFGFMFAMHHHTSYHHHPVAGVFAIAGWVVRIIARFNMKASLEEHFNGPDPVGLQLNGVMTFFFGGLYHQYHLNRIMDIKNAIRYRRAVA
jgi:MFS family permease